MTMHASELSIHRAIVAMLEMLALPGAIWFHVPNGELRNKRVGGKLKLMGVKPGVADLCFVLSNGMFAAMEIKAAGGTLSSEQNEFRARCEAMGALYVVVRSLDEAHRVLASWGVLRNSRGRVRREGSGGRIGVPALTSSNV